MKAGKTILFLCSWLVSLSLSAQALGDSLLAASLDSLIAHQLPKGSNVGLSVYDLTANRMLYEHQADRLSRPASTMRFAGERHGACALLGHQRPCLWRCVDEGLPLLGQWLAVGR